MKTTTVIIPGLAAYVTAYAQPCVYLNTHKCCSILRSYFCIFSRFKVKGVTTHSWPHDQHHCSGVAGHRVRFLCPYTWHLHLTAHLKLYFFPTPFVSSIVSSALFNCLNH